MKVTSGFPETRPTEACGEGGGLGFPALQNKHILGVGRVRTPDVVFQKYYMGKITARWNNHW